MLELDDIAEVVATAIKEATAPLVERIDAQAKLIAELEAREQPDVSGLCSTKDASRMIAEAVEAIPAPEPAPPTEGQDELLLETAEALAALGAEIKALAETVAALPGPEKGDPGEPGVVDMAAVAALLEGMVAASVAGLPVPQPGKDGVGLAEALRDAEGNLVLTLTNGETRNIGRIDGKDGETFALDDFDIIPLDDPRDFKFCFTRGEAMHSFELSLPGVVDQGVWKDGGEYRKGDGVSWGGQFWIAERDLPAKPDTADCGWRIAVKKGRDGKDAQK